MSVTSETVGGVLWDLDGTLIDSAGHHWIAWRDTLAALGRSVTPGDFANSFGKRNDEILHELFGPGIETEWIERVSETKEQAYRRLLRAQGLELLPGALAWFERLRSAGWRQALASSAPLPNIDAVFESLAPLGRYLDTVVSADEVGRGKPDPAVFLEAARRLACRPGAASWSRTPPPGSRARAGPGCGRSACCPSTTRGSRPTSWCPRSRRWRRTRSRCCSPVAAKPPAGTAAGTGGEAGAITECGGRPRDGGSLGRLPRGGEEAKDRPSSKLHWSAFSSIACRPGTSRGRPFSRVARLEGGTGRRNETSVCCQDRAHLARALQRGFPGANA